MNERAKVEDPCLVFLRPSLPSARFHHYDFWWLQLQRVHLGNCLRELTD